MIKCNEKNSSLISTKDSVAREYISKGQSSPYGLTFRFELGLNSYSKRFKIILIDLILIVKYLMWNLDINGLKYP